MLLFAVLTILAGIGSLIFNIIASFGVVELAAAKVACDGLVLPLLAITVSLWLMANDVVAARKERELVEEERGQPAPAQTPSAPAPASPKWFV